VQLETGSGLGSGVIFDHEGHVLTAAHVVGNANSVKVRLADGTVLDGDVVGADPATDVAVVQIQGQDAVADLPVATLATGVKLEVGQVAVAIGSPFGLDQTVTAGVVSAVNRAVPTDGGSALGMIQTDAPINPGNSGGALADRHGRVIGINDAIRSESGGNVGVGFAIPIDTAADVAKQLIAGEPLQTAFLGVTTTDQTGGTRAGALIAGVESGSPADDAGLQQGDLVVAVDGSPIEGSTDLVAAVRSSHPGDKVTLTIVRDGQERQLDVTLGQLQQ
jgi:S1-C subfamily serine protease